MNILIIFDLFALIVVPMNSNGTRNISRRFWGVNYIPLDHPKPLSVHVIALFSVKRNCTLLNQILR